MHHHLCSSQSCLVLLGLQLRLWKKHRWNHRFQPKLIWIKRNNHKHQLSHLRPTNSRNLVLCFPTKVCGNYPSANHWSVCRKNQIQISPYFRRFVVNPHLFTNRPLDVECAMVGCMYLVQYDFAGGIVVHIAAGLSALAAALVVGRRKGCVYWKDQLKH